MLESLIYEMQALAVRLQVGFALTRKGPEVNKQYTICSRPAINYLKCNTCGNKNDPGTNFLGTYMYPFKLSTRQHLISKISRITLILVTIAKAVI